MSAQFVAALIEGFEGTLDEVLDRLPDGKLRQDVRALQEHLSQSRKSLEIDCIGATQK